MITPYSLTLETAQIVEVYVYYDRPLLFACRDKLGHFYLAVLLDENDDLETWLYVELTEKRLQHVRSGGIDLRDAFAVPESGYVYLLTLENDEQRPSVIVVSAEDIKPEWLPEPGEFLSLETKTLKDVSEWEANRTLREVVNLRFKFPNLTRSEAPAGVLGQALWSFQAALNQIGSALFDTSVQMLVSETGGGSFTVQLQSREQANLFKESKASDAIREFIELINLGDNPELLKDHLRRIEIQASEKLLSFLKSLSADVDDLYIKWISPRPGYGGSAHLTNLDIKTMINTIELEEVSKTQLFEVTGRLRGVNLDTKYFSLVSDANQRYSGYFSDEAAASEVVQNAQINRRYNARIEEKEELKASIGKVTTTLTLIHLMPMDQDD